MKTMRESRTTPIWMDNRAIALLTAASLTVMANATISPALPGLERLFANDPNAAMLTRLLVPAPSLSVAICAPLAGLAADRFGRRRLLLVGVVLFVIVGCAGLFLPTLAAIFASRVMLGVAVALIMTTQTALIGDYFSGDDRSALMGMQIAARNFGGLIFISLAGWVAAASPRLVFAIYGLPVLVLPLMWRAIVDPVARAQTPTGATPEDVEREHPSWALLLMLLVLVQGITNMIFFVMPTQIAFYLQAEGFESTARTGAVLGTLMLTGGFCALLYPRIQRVTGYAGIFFLGYAAMGLGFLLLIVGANGPSLFAGAAAVGTGYALVSPGFVALALGLAPPRSRGLSGGILTASIFIGQFCSPLLSTPFIMMHGYEGLFQSIASVLGVMAAAAGVIGVAMWLRLRSSGDGREDRQFPA